MPTDLDQVVSAPNQETQFGIVALDDALQKLAEIEPNKVKIVELRYFAGLQWEEVAELMKLSTSTVKREWKTALRWLQDELGSSL